jgi:hypothetical protein
MWRIFATVGVSPIRRRHPLRNTTAARVQTRKRPHEACFLIIGERSVERCERRPQVIQDHLDGIDPVLHRVEPANGIGRYVPWASPRQADRDLVGGVPSVAQGVGLWVTQSDAPGDLICREVLQLSGLSLAIADELCGHQP